MVRRFSRIPVPLPVEDVYRRLGRNRHAAVVTSQQQDRLEARMQDAFALCLPQGCYDILRIRRIDNEVVQTEDDSVTFSSEALSHMLAGCGRLVLLATTVGADVVEKTAELIAKAEGADAVVYDATASETADAAMDWLCASLNRELPRTGGALTKQRFSPGYGDLALAAQRAIFDRLQLQEMGLTLTDSWMMVPEKSVTAIAGILTNA